jgi:peptide/nickel transport system substrate-binding protein
LALVTALSLSVVGCASAPPTTDAPDTIRIGISPDQLAGTYDPAGGLCCYLDHRAVYESLFTNNSSMEGGGFVPLLAEGYEQSEDWKTVTIDLRDDVTFVDGEKLTAATLKEFLDGMVGTPGWGLQALWDAKSPTLTVIDETTLEMSSDTSMPPYVGGLLYQLFTLTTIASPSVLDDLEGAKTDPIGSGPYLIESSTPQVGVTLVRNENYWNQDAFPFDRIELTTFADPVAAHNALTAGQIDAAKLPIPLADEAKSQGLTLNIEQAPGTNVLFLADREGTTTPALGDKRVRQAMALAFDREAINDALNLGYGVVTSQPFIDSQPEYVSDGDTRYGYDPERAKELLAEAGYPDGFDLTILDTPFGENNVNEPIVAQYLGDIGIRVTFETLETNGYFEAAFSNPQYSATTYGNLFSTTFAYYAGPNALFNPFKIQDPVVTELWKSVENGPLDAANEALAELGEYVLDESFVIVYKSSPTIWASAPGFEVSFFYANPLLSDFSYTG